MTQEEFKKTMEQEQEDKLFKYLCAALPYGVRVNYGGYEGCDCKLTLMTLQDFPTDDLKPYLRPMDSMTEEEENSWQYQNWCLGTNNWDNVLSYIEWLLEKHFDFLDLIDEGLAIKVNKDNNPYKD